MDEHYYTINPTSEIKEKSYSYTIKDKTLSFVAVSGVFSFDLRVDKASELLIKNFTPSASSILDMGCGYGPIGLFIKSIFPDQRVYMTDINNRAIEYAKLNAKNNRLEVNICQSDLFSNLTNKKFDDIVSNPPIAAGKKLLTGFINDSKNYLNPNGSLWLVAFHNKGGSTLKEIMNKAFGNVEDIEKSGGIRVYKAVNR
ncbi:MAG: methyltransferase [Clostridia bacterium]|nr:methyltransferase [Clostridia bacterium]